MGFKTDVRVAVTMVVMVLAGYGCATTAPGANALSEGYKAFDQKNYEKALEKFEEALKYSGQIEHHPSVVASLRNIGDTYAAQGKIDQAIRSYKEAVQYSKDYSLGPPFRSYKEAVQYSKDHSLGPADDIQKKIATLVANVLSEGYEAFDQKNYEEALKKFEEALEYSSQIEHGPSVVASLRNIGDTYAAQGKIDLAIRYYKEAVYSKHYHGPADDIQKKIATLIALPSDLVATAEYIDQSSVRPNRMLDAGENSSIVVTVTNKGEGTAFDVKVEAEADNSHVGFPGTISLGDIQPGQLETATITIKAGLGLTDGTVAFLIACKEKRGYDCQKKKIRVDTARLQRPNLVIKSVKINDGREGLAAGNGNGTIENGETAELQVFVENAGVGEAYGVNLSLVWVTPAGVEVIQRESGLGRIGVGETAKGKLVIRVPRAVQASAFEAKFMVEEVERKAAQAEKTVSLTGATLTPNLTIQVDWNDGAGGQAHGNGNGIWETGETIEGVLTIRNGGMIAAEGVDVTIQATNRGVDLSPQQFRVGRLGPNQTSMPLRTTVTIPRTYEGKEVVIETLAQQQDFPTVSDRQVQVVNLLRPSLVVTRRLLNQTKSEGETIGSVQQGEDTKLEIRVRNEGNLEARRVRVSVASERSEIQLESQKPFDIGIIPAGQISEPIHVPVRTLRAAAFGQAGITVEVSQEDFSGLKQKGMLMVREEVAEEIKVAGEEVKTPRPTATSQARSPIYVVSIAPAESVKKEFFEVEWDELDEVTHLEIFVNGEKMTGGTNRGMTMTTTSKANKSSGKRRAANVPLSPGLNTIVVTVYDRENKAWPQPPILITRQIERGEFWALLIGIDDYDDDKHWPRLSTAVKDVKTLQEVLRGRYGFASHRIKNLIDKHATREGMVDAFEWLVKNAGEHDNVLIYYAGHGERDNVAGYWVPVEAKQGKKTAYVPNSTVRDYIGALKAKHVYLVADSCFSGSIFVSGTRSKPPAITERYYQEVYERKSRQAITSGGNEPVSDAGYDGHSIFAYYFLKALRENNKPYLTAQDIITQIARPVANNSKQTPESQHIKDVQDEAGEFVFGLGGHLP